METLSAAIAGGQAGDLEQAAHRLKGSISNFAFPAAFHTAQKLEQCGKLGKLEKAEESFSLLEKQVRQLQTALAEEKIAS